MKRVAWAVAVWLSASMVLWAIVVGDNEIFHRRMGVMFSISVAVLFLGVVGLVLSWPKRQAHR